METPTKVFYRNYTIEQDPYGLNRFVYYPVDVRDHDCGWASSIDEAKDAIWEKVISLTPCHKVEMNGRVYEFEWIDEAIRFAALWNGNLYPICNP